MFYKSNESMSHESMSQWVNRSDQRLFIKKQKNKWIINQVIFLLVSLAAVFSVVTQRSSPDDTKNGCEGDYFSSR